MATTSCGRSRRHALLLATTVLVSGLAAPSYAASPHPNIDANGVDLTEGSFTISVPIASIGSGASELKVIANTGQRDNWSDVYATRQTSGGPTLITIYFGMAYDQFNSTNGFATSIRGTGATLTINSDDSYTYRTLDGVVIQFNNPVGASPFGGTSNFCDSTNTTGSCVIPASYIDRKSGLTTTFNWEIYSNCSVQQEPDEPVNCGHAYRLTKVYNDAGYSINWTFATDTVTGGVTSPAWYRRTSAELRNANVSASSWPTITYANPSTNVHTITTPGGKTWGFTGNSAGSTATGLRRPSASSDTTTASFSYSTGTNYTGTVVNNGITTSYNYSRSGSTATMVVTDAQSNVTTTVSDISKFRPTSFTDALSRTTSFTYDSIGRPTEITYPEGNKVQYTYDGRGNLTETRLKAKSGSGLSDITTTALYPSTCTDPSCNSPTWTKDALGNRTDYTYDTSTGLVTKITSPAPTSGANQPETRITYSTVSGVKVPTAVSTCQTGTAPSCVGTADEVKTTTSYNSNLLPTSVSKGAGDASLTATTAYTYDAIGNATYVDGPLSGSADTTRTLFTADREVAGAISADPDGSGSLPNRAVKTTYNSDGQITVVERGTTAGQSDSAWSGFSAAEKVTSTYDANARKTKDVLANGSTSYGVTQYSYDTLGRIECSAVRMNSAVWSSLPSSACTAGTTGSYGADRISKTTYDAAGQVTKVQTAYGQTEQADEQTLTYTTNGKVALVIDGEGNYSGYQYDGFDRQNAQFFPTTNHTGLNYSDYISVSYDANSNVTVKHLRDGQHIYYTYDNLNRLTFKDVPSGASYEYDVTYSYDLLGRLTQALDANTHVTNIGYDALSRQTSEQSNWTTRYSQYDLAGRRTRLTWGDGFYADYDHLVTGEVSAIRENGATSGVGVLGTYAYDNLGRLSTLTRGNGVVTSYAFDAVSRLSSLSHDPANTIHDVATTFTYNPASQIAASTRDNDAYSWGGHANKDVTETANGLNQLATQGATSLSYDGLGNVASIGGVSYGYTSENRLASGNGYAMTYDPLGRFHWITNAGISSWMQYDGGNIIEERGSSGVQRRYVYGPGMDNPLVWYEGSGTSDRRWLISDERGSVIAGTNVSGVVMFGNAYDEYGIPASTNTGRFGYTGQAWLPELGMWYYKARIYNPAIGRFMQTDPIGYRDGMNSYSYVLGDPVNSVDPSGLATYECTGSRIKCNDGGIAPGSSPGTNFGGGGGLTTTYTSGSSGVDDDGTIFVTSGHYTTTIGNNNPPFSGGFGGGVEFPIQNIDPPSASQIPTAEELVKRQQGLCKSDPAIAAALLDPSVQSALSDARSRAASTGNEYGFEYGRSILGGRGVTSVYSGDAGRLEIQSSIWSTLQGIWYREIQFHIHPNPTGPGLSGGPQSDLALVRGGWRVVAMTESGTMYCGVPR